MKRLTFLTGIIVLLLTAGCTKDFNLNIEKTDPLYVIQGRISNLRGAYFFRITKSTNLFPHSNRINPDSAEAVTGAEVIISDDMGIADTLKPANNYNIIRYAYYYRNGKLDSMLEPLQTSYSNKYRGDRGYYQTTKITGQPGHTYKLQVRIGNETFHATAYMPFVPELDSAIIKETNVNANESKGYLPYLYFKEPQNEKNYYHLQYNDIYDYPYDNPYGHVNGPGIFHYYVINDEILPPYVNGLAAQSLIPSHNRYNSTFPHLPGNYPVQVRLSSLTKEAYEYFRALGMQLEDDGNVYKPAPATARGNISGGALGLFWASHISYKLILP
jgi:hypothetical protein